MKFFKLSLVLGAVVLAGCASESSTSSSETTTSSGSSGSSSPVLTCNLDPGQSCTDGTATATCTTSNSMTYSDGGINLSAGSGKITYNGKIYKCKSVAL